MAAITVDLVPAIPLLPQVQTVVVYVSGLPGKRTMSHSPSNTELERQLLSKPEAV